MNIMKQTLFATIAAVVLLIGAVGCSKDDNSSSTDINVQEQQLVGLWWDEYEYADVTESGVPFSRAMLAVKVDADHTGCLYLGVFNDTDDEPLAVYGGPAEAGFTWHMLADGSVVLSDPATGENIALSGTRSGNADSSYGTGMTNVASTGVNYADGNVTVTNGDYSGTLSKADAGEQADIEGKLSTLSPDRQAFEAKLSQMLADSRQYIKLDPTMRAVNLLTEFISQLKIDALGAQIGNILVTVVSRENSINSISLTEPGAEEARWALANSNFADDAATSFALFNAAVILNNSALEFTVGKETADYVTTDDGAFTISCKNTTSGAVTKVRMTFSGADDGVIIFLGKLGELPLAIQFPHSIDLELLRSESGGGMDAELVMKGQVTMESTDGKKYISLKHGEWRATLYTEAEKADRYEMPTCTLTHHADHTVEASATLGINGKTVMTINGHNYNNPYSSEELEQLSELRDIAPMGKGLYTLLKAFNSRTAKAELTLMDDLLLDIDILDVGKGIKAAGNAMKYRHQNVPKETIDPWTDMLNESLTYTVTQKTTGVKCEGKFVTSLIARCNLPSFALRFQGESDFHVIHDRMNPTDRQNYEALLKGFDEPLTALNGLLRVIQNKGVELKAFNPFK